MASPVMGIKRLLRTLSPLRASVDTLIIVLVMLDGIAV